MKPKSLIYQEQTNWMHLLRIPGELESLYFGTFFLTHEASPSYQLGVQNSKRGTYLCVCHNTFLHKEFGFE